MVLTYKDYALLEEYKRKPAYMVFGRFNPPTAGHLLLLKSLGELAKKNGGVAFAFTSHSNDPKKNPLDYKTKIKYLKKLAPKGVNVLESDARNGAEALTELGKKGYKKVVFVTGSDRVKAYQSWSKYLDDFGLEEYEVTTIGKERNELSDDVDGMSASKMRKMVENNQKVLFIKNAPFDKKTNEELFNDVKKGMGL